MFKCDVQTQKFIVNYFTAQRVMGLLGVNVCSTLDLKEESNNKLWNNFDSCLSEVFQSYFTPQEQ